MTSDIVANIGKNLAADALADLRDLAADWWGALEPDQVNRIERQTVAIFSLLLAATIETDPDKKRQYTNARQAAGNAIRADIEAAGIVLERGVIHGVERVGVKLLLGAVGL